YTLAEGVPMAAAAVIDAADASITGIGQVDLRARTIDMRLTPSTRHPDLAGRLVPVIARGPLSEPELHIDPLSSPERPDQITGSAMEPGTAPRVDGATIGNPCTRQLDLVVANDGAETTATSATSSTDAEVAAGTATQTARKRSVGRQFRGFLEAFRNDIDVLLGSGGKPGRPTPITKRASGKLR
ncbi:MAG: hypothetical protein ACREEV_18765, partial [Dongiaceae bacterium]